jgi:two-component system cell cycle sensor histidine kinase/response regulator CckA
VLVLDRGEELNRAAARAHTEMRLTRVFQSAPFGIATADAAGRIVTANAAFMRMFAVEGRGVPATVAALVSDGEEEAGRELAKALERAISGRTGAAPIEVFFGAQRELARRIYVSALHAGPHSREGAVLYAIDATEQKALVQVRPEPQDGGGRQARGRRGARLQQRADRHHRLLRLLLQTHRQTGSLSYRDIMNIKSSANRRQASVRQLLAFSRRQTLQPEVLEPGEALTDLALVNRSLARDHRLKILPGRDLWYIKADKTQLTQVIINLAVNAKDAMPEGGCLHHTHAQHIRAREHQARNLSAYRRRVRPDRSGRIPASASRRDVMAKIFEPFFTTKDVQGKGTGWPPGAVSTAHIVAADRRLG